MCEIHDVLVKDRAESALAYAFSQKRACYILRVPVHAPMRLFGVQNGRFAGMVTGTAFLGVGIIPERGDSAMVCHATGL